MPVPDNVIFGPNGAGGQFNYGQVRGLDKEAKYHALKLRLDTFLVNQINELGPRKGLDDPKVDSPFPLFLLTCVAIEALGKALCKPSSKMSDEDAQREAFLAVCKEIDKAFSRPLGGVDKTQYDALWGNDEHKKVKSFGHILYRFGRHTMIHGFRGKGVYITTTDTKSWTFSNGAIALNPYWFWLSFRTAYDALWNDFFANKEPTNSRKRSADDFLAEILG